MEDSRHVFVSSLLLEEKSPSFVPQLWWSSDWRLMVDKQVPEGLAASSLFQESEEGNAMLLGSVHSARSRVPFFVFDPPTE